ncbi:Tpr and ankyrin repeat-containing protein [Thalictrum thalictroides]|uniref:Tpr and ankyrin repeat-containing protein n=1 Tax=Thalictrum thalictroides TaxID=46969 RepID=A0A7J6WX34_THATH|nr:Tpr and ankyrin repeat-containing protein [Thalictrum thalictroides]
MASSSKKRAPPRISDDDNGLLIDVLFSWTLQDVFNEGLYKDKVERIPDSFQSVDEYLGSYIFPLLEETRAELCSSMEVISKAPFSEVTSLEESKPYGSFLYNVKVDSWRNRSSGNGKDSYRPKPGDVFILSDALPEIIDDLERYGTTWNYASVMKVSETDSKVSDGDEMSVSLKIKTSKAIEIKEGMRRSLYVVFLINIITNTRIWFSLHKLGNMKILKEVLCPDPTDEEFSNLPSSVHIGDMHADILGATVSSLNESQAVAVWSCIATLQNNQKPTLKLVWGPPGTGKTKTVSTLLCTLLKMKCRTLACAPTNVAITELSGRVLKLVRESGNLDSVDNVPLCSLGDLLLFGNNDRLKVDGDLEEIFLDYRVDRLLECFVPLTGWRHCFTSMIDFLESSVSQYHIFLENESSKEEHKECVTSFIEFTKNRFSATALPLKRSVSILSTHLPIRILSRRNFQSIGNLLGLLESFESLLSQGDMDEKELELVFAPKLVDSVSVFETVKSHSSALLYKIRRECLVVLRSLYQSINNLDVPNCYNKYEIRDFCFNTASLFFCTTSSSYKLHSVVMKPLDLVVIDEAAQLKECESTIPLQISGIRHVFLFGDELQLPALVNSEVSKEAAFGRSLFERLSSMRFPKHLLNMQYRMHKEISCFPNSKFYQNKILDAPNVMSESHEKYYLPGPLFGPYSFISVDNGKEEFDSIGHSRKNMVEVAVVITIVRKLFKAWEVSREKISIGIISPYAAQVAAIQAKLGLTYENFVDFEVKVKSVDGFQGGEEDIIIFSAVRSNNGGAIGFLSNPQRTNVALTRAKHCLWILGNGTTLANSESVWAELVKNAKHRRCFFHADEEQSLAKAIIQVKKELDQLDSLLNEDSILFKSSRWKVLFSDNFRKSFGNLKSSQLQWSVINLLLKLSGGWRPKKRNINVLCENSSQLVQQFKIEGLYLISTIDIVKQSIYVQVLKIWDIIPLDEIPKLVKRLDNIFGMYTDDFISHCKVKCIEGNLEVPMAWGPCVKIVRNKVLSSSVAGSVDGSTSDSKRQIYVENSKVTESLLLMKFYSLSSGMVSHLLSANDGRELDLPFEVTEHEQEIIHFPRSTFILGRSGTGKTTVLTMKLIQKEKQYYFSTEGLCDVKGGTFIDYPSGNKFSENHGGTKGTVLRQLFVTVSPKLCGAIRTHVSNLMSYTCGGKFQNEHNAIDMLEIDDTTQFKDIPDSFNDMSVKSYPLIVTFQKFLLMLDNSMENSFFERFQNPTDFSLSKSRTSSSISLQAFLRTNEVNFDRFNAFYWPHFNSQLTKKLDSSTVFTEIISHLKGGLKEGKVYDGKLTREDYLSLSEGRVSSLSRDRREDIYDIFLDYEKKKTENCQFDLADFVNDLHCRLRHGLFDGDLIDFVYIDEVQDLTMRQIALFKYICRNVDEGFVFSGDTAQTIARGIDFRFQDIKALFYNEFMGFRGDDKDIMKAKDQRSVSDIFQLNQNFRTHAGVLNLSQSVIELLYHYFPFSVDVLGPETSLIYGEAPVLLQSGNDENAIVCIFGNNGISGGNIVGFGAEQVILVRDDCARKEVAGYVGKQALVLTILECKGLEFQDVLLYNFFGTSPLKNQWRVVYEYMKENDMLDSSAPRSFPNFSKAKHSVLCSELKQLYVAITRTRQRLWICDNMEQFSMPMFDYWKRLGLVQVRQLDDSLAQAMQVASSKEEWSARGVKLFNEGNFEMATMCFERAADSYREKWSRAAGLRASADRIQGSNSEQARVALKNAAEIYESISKADLAAKCYIELKQFKRAGKLYLEKCGESRLEDAGDCFSLAGCWSEAADVYARGKCFSKCLSVCTKGELFGMGLNFIKHWKEDASQVTDVVIKRQHDFEGMEQEFLERCARHYHELRDTKTMMKFVEEFKSIDSVRTFLRSCNYLNELLLLEEEWGNYIEAASIARDKGDLLFEADLLAKGDLYEDASMLILLYVLGRSLWATGSKGWPLKYFAEKEELLQKVKNYAMIVSEGFYGSVCLETGILSNQEMSLIVMRKTLSASENLASPRVQIISVWKILDMHLQLHPSKYEWEHEVVLKEMKDANFEMFRTKVSIESLIYYWNCWQEKVGNVLEYLKYLGTQHEINYVVYEQFCLAYLGVRKVNSNRYTVYNEFADACWMKGISEKSLQRTGDLVSMDAHQFSFAAKTYWLSQVLLVGMEVLEKLDALHRYFAKMSNLIVCRGSILLHIFEVSKYIMEFNDWKCHPWALPKLSSLCQSSGENFFDIVLPTDWRQVMTKSTVFLRSTKSCKDLLEEVIIKRVVSKSKFSHGKVGRMVMLLIAFGNINEELYDKIAQYFNVNQAWETCILQLKDFVVSNMGLVSFVCKLKEALQDTYSANWRREFDYISPHCFIYLVERLVFFLSSCQQNFYTTKSSIIEILACENWQKKSSAFEVAAPLGECYAFIAKIVWDILSNRQNTFDWLFKSKTAVNEDYPLLVLRLVVVICLVCLNTGQYFDLLSNLLSRNDIKSQLPSAFCEILQRKRRNLNFRDVVAKALNIIGNPLAIVCIETKYSQFLCPEVLVVDLNMIQCREDVMNVLFPENPNVSLVQEDTSEVQTESSSTSDPSSCNAGGANIAEYPLSLDVAGQDIQKLESGKKSEEMSKQVECSDGVSSIPNVPDFKKFVESYLEALDTATDLKDEEKQMRDELKQLSVRISSNKDEEERISDIMKQFSVHISSNASHKEAIKEYWQNKPEIKQMYSMISDMFAERTDESSQAHAPIVAENSNDNDNKGKTKEKGRGNRKQKKNKKKSKGKK